MLSLGGKRKEERRMFKESDIFEKH